MDDLSGSQISTSDLLGRGIGGQTAMELLTTMATTLGPGEILSSDRASSSSNHTHGDENCKSSFELVMITLTLPLWTFCTFYLMLLLIYYLRRLQYFSVYDKCNSRNAHFQYDFHMLVGRHSANYNRNELVIIDLLDNQMTVSLTIQVPGPTIFNDYQMFMYRHARNNIRCVTFTVYRKNPIKDVKSIRAAHTCSNLDSRLYIYGLDVHDRANGEARFFPIQSVVKYRGTQWALVTTFEPKPELNFKKLGLDCYDPFGYSVWPTYLDMLTIVLYIWCSSFGFGHLISIKAIANSIPLHSLTLLFIVATSAAVLSALYLRVIKTHIVDLHYDSFWWHAAQRLYTLLVIIVSLAFWSLALSQADECRQNSAQWLISTASCALILTMLTAFIWIISNLRRGSTDRALLAETDANLARTNSKEAMAFMADPAPGICAMITSGPAQKVVNGSTRARLVPQGPAPPPPAQAAQPVQATTKNPRGSGSGAKRKQEPVGGGPLKAAKTGDDETLDTAFGHGSKYIKTKNRNSIAQYV